MKRWLVILMVLVSLSLATGSKFPWTFSVFSEPTVSAPGLNR